MTIEEIHGRVAEIARNADDDPEKTKGEIDCLWQDVLQGISEEEFKNPMVAAWLALKTTEIKYRRWNG